MNDVGLSRRNVLMNGVVKTSVRPLFSSPQNRSITRMSQKSQNSSLSRKSKDSSIRGDRGEDGRGGGNDINFPGRVNSQATGSVPLVPTEAASSSLGDSGTAAAAAAVGVIGDPIFLRSTTNRMQEVLGALPILLVDDSVSILKMTKRAIQNECANISFIEAKNGEEAFEKVVEAFTSFGLIVTDIQMPICNGFEFTRRVRALEQDKGLTPKLIIGISANDQQKIAEEAKESGMVLS